MIEPTQMPAAALCVMALAFGLMAACARRAAAPLVAPFLDAPADGALDRYDREALLAVGEGLLYPVPPSISLDTRLG